MHTVYLLLAVFAVILLDVVALVQIWRNSSRSSVAQILWTLVIVMLPLIGGVGWFVNWSLGRAAARFPSNSVRLKGKRLP